MAADNRSGDPWLGQWLERSRRPVENEQPVAGAGSRILEDQLVAFAGKGILMEIETLTAAGQARESNDTIAGVRIEPFIAQRQCGGARAVSGRARHSARAAVGGCSVRAGRAQSCREDNNQMRTDT